ncbi:LysR family transcriptional regulator [Alcaligenaceae bacterium]|nr:LysR family transcriptional regulator [Alcaligenaceae bacterium]
MKLNFKTLSTFLAVAENASFRKAASQIHLSIPAVSMQIKQMEERLGVALFQRTTRKVVLTQEGEQLLISTRKAMAEIRGALAHIQQVADIQQGHLSFACVPTVAGTRLPALLMQFASDFPGITIQVREVSQPELLNAVRRREVDFGIGPEPDHMEEFECQLLFKDSYVAVVPESHHAAAKTSISMQELSKMRVLSLGASQFQGHIQATLEKEGLSLDPSYEFTHVNTVIAMIEAGLGVGILPGVAAPQSASLKVLRIVPPTMARDIAAIKIRGHSLSPAAARFVTMCEELMPPSSTNPERMALT